MLKCLIQCHLNEYLFTFMKRGEAAVILCSCGTQKPGKVTLRCGPGGATAYHFTALCHKSAMIKLAEVDTTGKKNKKVKFFVGKVTESKTT